jgi:hypothetical protein
VNAATAAILLLKRPRVVSHFNAACVELPFSGRGVNKEKFDPNRIWRTR